MTPLPTSPPERSACVAGADGELHFAASLDTVVACRGELDRLAAPCLDRVTRTADHRDVVTFDLAGVTFVDAGGLDAVLRTLESARMIELVAVPRPLLRLLEITGTDQDPRVRVRSVGPLARDHGAG